MIVYRKHDLKCNESVANRKFRKKDKCEMENRRTVFLADANEEFRAMMRKAIERSESFTVVGTAGDGTEALKMIECQRPDLVVMDLMLPGTDGFGVLRQIRELEEREVEITATKLKINE